MSSRTEHREADIAPRFVSVQQASVRSGLRMIEIDELCVKGAIENRLADGGQLLVSLAALDAYVDALPSGASR